MTIPPAEPAAEIAAALSGYTIQRGRYRRTIRFAFNLFLRVVWWEVVLRRLVGDMVVRQNRPARFKRWAHDFRLLAGDMGGVMIKLGQFVSSRVDILPPDVIEELAKLQDNVPTVPFDKLRETLDAELGPLDKRFASFDPTPIAAASLGQVHRARLLDGTQVVVKVQRPGIGSLVHTDLTALGVIARAAMRFRFIAQRANVPALLNEFSEVLWNELNYRLEAEHAEQFAAMFHDNPGVYIPRVYRDHSTGRVVTLEDVTAIKITDFERLEAAGLDRRDVARRLISTYLWMVFTQPCFHADPHPGNLFIYPLPPGAPSSNGQHANDQPLLGKPFYLIFVDFGMVGQLTPQIVSGLTETLHALTARDAHRLVQSYQRLGILLPGANIERIEEAARTVFDRVWGLNMSELSRMQVSEMRALGREFSDLIFAMPFQVPQDYLYLARCVGMLSGICTGLDPSFDPWREIQPFARTLLGDFEASLISISGSPRELLNPKTLRGLLSEKSLNLLMDAGWNIAQQTVQLIPLADDVLRRANRGELTIRVTPAPDMERQFRRMEHAIQRLVSAVMFCGLIIGSALLYTSGEHTLGYIGFALALFTFWRVIFEIGAR